jgi:hypothetical protein
MNESNKTKNQSPLVKSVLSLDAHFGDLERLSARIEEMPLKSEFDFNQARQLMTRFAESANLVSTEIVELANFLSEARLRAEENGKLVAAKAELLQARMSDEEQKMNEFRVLTGKVTALNESIKDMRKPDGQTLSDEERAQMAARLSEINLQIQPLIEEALVLKDVGRTSKIKILEQNADSLSQSLMAVSAKMQSFITPNMQ